MTTAKPQQQEVDNALRAPAALDFEVLHEVVKAAKAKLQPGIWDYLVGATETETTMRRNRHGLDTIALRPRVLRDVSKIDTSAEFMGKKTRIPVAMAPVGSLESFEAGGGATAGRAAQALGVPLFLSSVTKPGLEAVADAAPDARKIFQLYVRGDDAFVDDYVKRAKAAGYESFCITVDTAIYSRRERDMAKRFVKPWRVAATGHDFQASFSWSNIKRFKDKHDIPLILKGIGTAEDAALACEHGVDGIYVSNHGGRQLDHGRGSIEVLPEVVKAVAGRAKVIVDGGFSRGTDVVKAIALGADLVVVGRLFCYGLAAGGEPGIVRTFELLETEIKTAMGLCGVASYKELDQSFIHAPAPGVAAPHVHSAFPLIAEGY